MNALHNQGTNKEKSKVVRSEKGGKYMDFRKHEIKQILKCLDGILHEPNLLFLKSVWLMA